MGFGTQILKKFFGRQNETTKAFWIDPPNPDNAGILRPFLSDEKLFKTQIDDIANFHLLEDSPLQPIHEWGAEAKSHFKWIGKGEILAGSSMTGIANETIKVNDIDIYVHSKEDAAELIALNGMKKLKYESEFCTNALFRGLRINIIWGVSYNDARHLISRFDIRACAMAYDPGTDRFLAVDGAIQEARSKVITFQATARAVSVHRLLKYTVEKGFSIDKYQRTIFAELIKTGRHENSLELVTGYGER